MNFKCQTLERNNIDIFEIIIFTNKGKSCAK